MLLTGKQPAEQLYSKIDERGRSMASLSTLARCPKARLCR